LHFSNFHANFFWIFHFSNRKKSGQKNFAAKKIRLYEFSFQKFLAGKKFTPYGQDTINQSVALLPPCATQKKIGRGDRF